MRVANVSIGADPELFIINETTGKVVSSIGLIPGVKGNPWVGSDMPSGFGIETDNILAEFNIPPTCRGHVFIEHIEYMKNYINNYVKAKNPELGILCKASMLVDEDQLQSPEAKMFGCDVDYNAYTEAPNPKPKGERTNLRSAGFHIHLGYRDFNVDTSLQLIKYLDMYLGIPSLLKDSDTNRRNLYGKAGCFRLTPYGLEYRVLSSELMSTRENLEFVWQQVSKAILAHNSSIDLIPAPIVVDTINNSNVENAKVLIAKYGLV